MVKFKITLSDSKFSHVSADSQSQRAARGSIMQKVQDDSRLQARMNTEL
jgi:hypothetical protein